MPKDKWIHMRIDSELKARIRGYAKENNYDDVTKFILDIVKEKIESDEKREGIKKELMELLKDPKVRQDLGMD